MKKILRALLLFIIGSDLQNLGLLLILENRIWEPDSTRLMLFLVGMIAGNLSAWGWMIITGMAFAEKPSGILHGVLCLLVPGYAFIFGIVKRDAYVIYVVMGFVGVITQVVCIAIALTRVPFS